MHLLNSQTVLKSLHREYTNALLVQNYAATTNSPIVLESDHPHLEIKKIVEWQKMKKPII